MRYMLYDALIYLCNLYIQCIWYVNYVAQPLKWSIVLCCGPLMIVLTLLQLEPKLGTPKSQGKSSRQWVLTTIKPNHILLYSNINIYSIIQYLLVQFRLTFWDILGYLPFLSRWISTRLPSCRAPCHFFLNPKSSIESIESTLSFFSYRKSPFSTGTASDIRRRHPAGGQPPEVTRTVTVTITG